MSNITSIKCVLTQEHLNSVCSKYFVPEEVHPQLPGPDDTMHERPAGKVGMYTRFFHYANYRIPFSNFFVSILIHFRISFSQLSVFGYAKNLDSVKNWNDHFFWVDEFMVPANTRFNWFSGSNVSKDRAPTASKYNVEHAAILITHASPFLRFTEEFLCWVGISRNYFLIKDTYPRFEYESGEEMDLNAFIRTADPRKVKIVERARAENEEPIVTVAKHRTVTPLPTLVVRPSGDFDAEHIVPVTAGVATKTRSSRAKRPKKKRVAHESGDTPAATHPPKRLRADYGNTSGFVIGGKSPGVLNRFLRASQLIVEQGVAALPTLPFNTSSVTALPLEEGGGHTDSATASTLRTVGPSERFVVLSDSSHYSSAKSADAEVDSLNRSAALVMTAATTVITSVSATATTAVALTDFNKDKNGDIDTSLQEVYIPEWTVTKGFELNDGWSCANMIDHFTPPAYFKTVRGMEHEQLFAEFNVSAARNLSLSSKVMMLAEYNILEKRKWRYLAEERNDLL
ncbi:hypothetical protein Tco_0891061 [Tanacetum coccineum]|uniref:Uncharacterized protein n=1 Tax=Tanacetum coccineum TaxID=301880 RepID=A0ABQ5C3N1_9ASTR